MPSNIIAPITLAGLNAGGDQNFTFLANYYWGNPTTGDCSSTTFYSETHTLTVTTPVTQSRTFQLATEENTIRKTSLFPNPNSGEFALQLPSGADQAQLVVTDLSGKKVFSAANYFSGDAINLKGLAKGLYFVKVTCNQASETLKFIVE